LGLSSRRRSAPPPAGAHQPLPKKVVYFHGCSSNYYEPHVGIAAIEVLERNGCEVVLGQQQCCGLPMLSNGEFDAARRAHRGNLRKLLPWVRRGYAVVGTSTSCTLTLKEEAPELLGWHDDEVRLLAENTYDIFEYLRLLDGEGRFNRLLGRVAGEQPYHPPCQLKAHRIGLPALDILALVPGAEIATSGAACCGIAGTYGLKREKYDIAMAVGAPLFDWVSARQAEATLCDSETCRWQITHATGKPSRHPVELLRDSYRAYAGEKPAQAQEPSS
ncbi:MAG TPA: anaerobic glycerol-3-phosphate dehydrogenase subunit C, partial [Herpetosiphonaceae bacterium]